MKGYTVPTYLVPYGPEIPKSGMVKEASSNQVEVFWYPPSGDFKKYLLCIERMTNQSDLSKYTSFRNTSMMSSANLCKSSSFNDIKRNLQADTMRFTENLSTKATTHIIPGLDPSGSLLSL